MKAYETYRRIRENVARAIVGRGEVVDLAIVALFCGQHLLLEDVPGTGKRASHGRSPPRWTCPLRGCSSPPTCSPPI